MSTQPGLRERKKKQTYEAIARAAHELFVVRGYEATTLAGIADAANVSTRTIFAYFSSKEDILFSDLSETKDALAEALAARPQGKDALETVRKFMLSSERVRLRQHLHLFVTQDSMLRSHLRARIAQFEDVIAPAIAQDLGTSEEDTRTQLVAGALIAALNLLLQRGASKDELWTPEEITAQIDPVFIFLRGGLEALTQSRGGSDS